MLVEAAASLATPWPLKIVIDNVVGNAPLPGWLVRLLGPALAANRPALAAGAALAMVAAA